MNSIKHENGFVNYFVYAHNIQVVFEFDLTNFKRKSPTTVFCVETENSTKVEKFNKKIC
jgi:hypothetical protein